MFSIQLYKCLLVTGALVGHKNPAPNATYKYLVKNSFDTLKMKYLAKNASNIIIIFRDKVNI